MGCIDITAWREEKNEVVANATGELDMAYCLSIIESDSTQLLSIKQIEIKKYDDAIFDVDIQTQKQDAVFEYHVSISDFMFEVKAERN